MCRWCITYHLHLIINNNNNNIEQVGYSGHEEGVAVSVAAACRGARIIERHFTLDKAWRGSDHRCSLDPAEMALLCRHVRAGTEIIMVRE